MIYFSHVTRGITFRPPSTFYGVTHYIDETSDPTVPPSEEISTIIVPKDTVIKAAHN